MQTAAESLKEKRAPGPDEIQAEAVKTLVKEKVVYIKRVINDLYSRGYFPKVWKRATLVLI